MKFNFAVADVVTLHNDEYGLSAKVRVSYRGDSAIIRWGLDEPTYDNLQACIKSHQSTPKPLVRPDFSVQGDLLRLGLPRVADSDTYLIPAFFLSDLREASFECSAMFASNMNWLCAIQSINELDAVRWYDSTAALEHLAATPNHLDAGDEGPLQLIDQETALHGEHGTGQRADRKADRKADHRAEQKADQRADKKADKIADQSAMRVKSKWRTRTLQYGVLITTLLVVSSGYASLPQLATKISAEDFRTGNSETLAARTGPITTNPIKDSTRETHSKPGGSTKTKQNASNSVLGSSAADSTVAMGEGKAPANARGTSGQPALTNRKDVNIQSSQATQNGAPAAEVWKVPKGEVALTFDDGPTPLTDDFVKVLKQYGVQATFFFVGHQVQYWPDSVKSAAEAGDAIGDHSMTHPDLTNLNSQQQTAQILNDKMLLARLSGQAITLFRPPYGAFNDTTDGILKAHGMSLALWNRDPRDWQAKTPAEVVKAVLNSDPSGGVYDLHEKDVTLAALPDIIKGLQARHLKLVTLSAVSVLTADGQPTPAETDVYVPVAGSGAEGASARSVH